MHNALSIIPSCKHYLVSNPQVKDRGNFTFQPISLRLTDWIWKDMFQVFKSEMHQSTISVMIWFNMWIYISANTGTDTRIYRPELVKTPEPLPPWVMWWHAVTTVGRCKTVCCKGQVSFFNITVLFKKGKAVGIYTLVWNAPIVLPSQRSKMFFFQVRMSKYCWNAWILGYQLCWC